MVDRPKKSIFIEKIDNPMFHGVDFTQTEIVIKIVRVHARLTKCTLLHGVDRSNQNPRVKQPLSIFIPISVMISVTRIDIVKRGLHLHNDQIIHRLYLVSSALLRCPSVIVK